MKGTSNFLTWSSSSLFLVFLSGFSLLLRISLTSATTTESPASTASTSSTASPASSPTTLTHENFLCISATVATPERNNTGVIGRIDVKGGVDFPLNFELLDNTDFNGTFWMERRTGRLRIAHPLDAETLQRYTLRVRVSMELIVAQEWPVEGETETAPREPTPRRTARTAEISPANASLATRFIPIDMARSTTCLIFVEVIDVNEFAPKIENVTVFPIRERQTNVTKSNFSINAKDFDALTPAKLQLYATANKTNSTKTASAAGVPHVVFFDAEDDVIAEIVVSDADVEIQQKVTAFDLKSENPAQSFHFPLELRWVRVTGSDLFAARLVKYGVVSGLAPGAVATVVVSVTARSHNLSSEAVKFEIIVSRPEIRCLDRAPIRVTEAESARLLARGPWISGAPNGSLVEYFVENTTFRIGEDGALWSTEGLDHEAQPRHVVNFSVAVASASSPTGNKTRISKLNCSVEVELIDINDNDPIVVNKFCRLECSNNITVANDSIVGESIVRYRINDRDSGNDTNLSYLLRYLNSSSANSTPFIVEKRGARCFLLVAQDLTPFINATFELEVVVVDSGYPPRETTVDSLKVTVAAARTPEFEVIVEEPRYVSYMDSVIWYDDGRFDDFPIVVRGSEGIFCSLIDRDKRPYLRVSRRCRSFESFGQIFGAAKVSNSSNSTTLCSCRMQLRKSAQMPRDLIHAQVRVFNTYSRVVKPVNISVINFRTNFSFLLIDSYVGFIDFVPGVFGKTYPRWPEALISYPTSCKKTKWEECSRMEYKMSTKAENASIAGLDASLWFQDHIYFEKETAEFFLRKEPFRVKRNAEKQEDVKVIATVEAGFTDHNGQFVTLSRSNLTFRFMSGINDFVKHLKIAHTVCKLGGQVCEFNVTHDTCKGEISPVLNVTCMFGRDNLIFWAKEKGKAQLANELGTPWEKVFKVGFQDGYNGKIYFSKFKPNTHYELLLGGRFCRETEGGCIINDNETISIFASVPFFTGEFFYKDYVSSNEFHREIIPQNMERLSYVSFQWERFCSWCSKVTTYIYSLQEKESAYRIQTLNVTQNGHHGFSNNDLKPGLVQIYMFTEVDPNFDFTKQFDTVFAQYTFPAEKDAECSFKFYPDDQKFSALCSSGEISFVSMLLQENHMQILEKPAISTNDIFEINENSYSTVKKESHVGMDISFWEMLKHIEESNPLQIFNFLGGQNFGFQWNITIKISSGEGKIALNAMDFVERSLECINCTRKGISYIDLNPNLDNSIVVNALSTIIFRARITILLKKNKQIDNYFMTNIVKNRLQPSEIKNIPLFKGCLSNFTLNCGGHLVSPEPNFAGCLSLFSNCLPRSQQISKIYNSNVQKINQIITVKNFRQCSSGYTGAYPNCTDINECVIGDPCRGFECLNLEGGYSCSPCKAGQVPVAKKILDRGIKASEYIPFYRNILISFDEYFEGLAKYYDYKCIPNQCTTVREYFMENSEFRSITKTVLCHEHAVCSITNTTRACICKEGYRGAGTECTNIDECQEKQPCAEFQDCINLNPGHFCQCPAGRYGKRCETSICQKNPCYYGGKCIASKTVEYGYICDCPLSHTGKNCTQENEVFTFRPPTVSYSSAHFVMMENGKRILERDGLVFKARIKTYESSGAIFSLASQNGNADNTYIGRMLEIRNSTLFLVIYSTFSKPYSCSLKPSTSLSNGDWKEIFLHYKNESLDLKVNEEKTNCIIPRELRVNFTELGVVGGLGQPEFEEPLFEEIKPSRRSRSFPEIQKPLLDSFKGLLQGTLLNGEKVNLNTVHYNRPPIDDNNTLFFLNKKRGILNGIVNDDKCQYNRGLCLNNGTCITIDYNIAACNCSEPYHGGRCEKILFCEAIEENNIKYPRLGINRVYRSQKKCLQNGKILSKVTRTCYSVHGSAQWSQPNIINKCESANESGMFIATLLQINNDLGNKPDEVVLSNLSEVSSAAESYNLNDFKLTVQIIDELSFNDITKLDETLIVMSNLQKVPALKAEPSQAKSLANDAVKIVDRIIINAKIPENQSEITSFASNIVMTKRRVLLNKRLSGFILKSSKGSFNNESILTVDGENNLENIDNTDSPAVVILPLEYTEDLLKNNENTVSFAAYKDPIFFVTTTVEKQQSTTVITTELDSIVIACTLGQGEKLNKFRDGQFVQVRFKLFKRKYDTAVKNPSHRCVFWDDSSGSWSTDGCSLISNRNDSVICQCDHLTNLAVLFSYQNSIDKKAEEVLDIISKVFLAISIVCLALIIVFFAFFPELRKNRIQQVIFAISLSLLITYIFFLLAIENTPTQNPILCQAGAVIIHYFLLSAFCWTSVEAVVQYFLFVKVLGTYVSKFMLKGAVFAHGFPLIIVVIVLAIDVNFYGPSDISDNRFCWLDTYPFFLALVLPIGLILLVNIVCFSLVMKALLSKDTLRGRSNKENLPLARIGIVLFVSLGLTWAVGFLLLVPTRLVGEAYTTAFAYLFTILNALQGFMLFCLHSLRNPAFRRRVRWIFCPKEKLDSISGQNSSSDPKWSLYGGPRSKSSKISRLTAKDERSVASPKSSLYAKNIVQFKTKPTKGGSKLARFTGKEETYVVNRTPSDRRDSKESTGQSNGAYESTGQSNGAYESNDSIYATVPEVKTNDPVLIKKERRPTSFVQSRVPAMPNAYEKVTPSLGVRDAADVDVKIDGVINYYVELSEPANERYL